MKSRVFSLVLSGELRSRDEKSLNRFLGQVEAKNIFAAIVDERLPLWSILIFYEGETGDGRRAGAEAEPEEEIILTPEEQQLYEKLREWRWERAKEENVPGYIIARNVSLQLLAKSNIKSEEDLLSIRGIGRKKVDQYGAEILRLLSAFQGDKAQE